ncbi:MAG TPA: tetratricopeptide repeat protein, partial [Myxococcales bacterium]|nr:tetratricopeptide repeat protein [Myxococcales bacterium]
KEEIDIRYQAAVLLYGKGHAAESARRFGEIITRWPEDPRSQAAADLTMSVLEARQQWADLARVSAELAANKRLARSGTPFAHRVQQVLEGARYKWIDEVVIKQEKDPGRGAEELIKYVEELPRSRYADRALTYAMLLDRDQQKLERAVATGERVLKDYPGSPLEPKVRYTLSTLYAQLAELPRAARMAESFVAAYDKQRANLEQQRKKDKGKKKQEAGEPGEAQDPQADRLAQEAELLAEAEAWVPDAEANAALWNEALGQPDQAAAAYQRYLARFKDRPDAPQTQYALGVLYERRGKWAEAARAFEKFESSYGRDGRVKPQQLVMARYRQLLAWQALHDARKVEGLAGEVARAYERLGEDARKDQDATAAYAHARFLQVEPLWKRYAGIKLSRMTTVRQDLAQKQKLLGDLQKSYGEVLKLGVGEWGIAALVRIGLGYADIGRDIMESPTPRGLPPDQQQLYREELEKVALPLEDKAVEALNLALSKAYELSIYSEWTQAAQEQLNALRPGTYPRARDVRPPGTDAFRAAELEKDAPAGAGGAP